MSKSSNARSAPLALRTLTASGTTSFPTPSPGTTATRLGRSGFLFAQLEALDLAGQRLRQLRHELDQVRELIALEPGLAVLLQILDKRFAGRSFGLRNDEGLDLDEAIHLHADHGALRDRRVREQGCFDLDRRDPEPAHLDHVVGPALV